MKALSEWINSLMDSEYDTLFSGGKRWEVEPR
jgi:hypothetical protein